MSNNVYGKKIKEKITAKKYVVYKNEFLERKRSKKIVSRISILDKNYQFEKHRFTPGASFLWWNKYLRDDKSIWVVC